jgi:rhodanese-related sulfurtransferase
MRLANQLGLLWGVALIPAMISGFHSLQWKKDPSRVEIDTVLSWKEAVIWVDARSREDYEAKHWPEAVLLNLDEWDDLVPGFLEVWDPRKKIVVYCDGGACRASEEVAGRIRAEFGHEKVFVLNRGWDALKDKLL